MAYLICRVDDDGVQTHTWSDRIMIFSSWEWAVAFVAYSKVIPDRVTRIDHSSTHMDCIIRERLWVPDGYVAPPEAAPVE